MFPWEREQSLVRWVPRLGRAAPPGDGGMDSTAWIAASMGATGHEQGIQYFLCVRSNRRRMRGGGTIRPWSRAAAWRARQNERRAATGAFPFSHGKSASMIAVALRCKVGSSAHKLTSGASVAFAVRQIETGRAGRVRVSLAISVRVSFVRLNGQGCP